MKFANEPTEPDAPLPGAPSDDTPLPVSLERGLAQLPLPKAATTAEVERIMQAVRQSARVPLFTPRRLVTASFALAAAALIWVGVRSASMQAPPTQNAQAVAVASRVIRFQLAVADIERVSVVGDFNGWNASATPMLRDSASGSWVANVKLAEGRYLYAFVVNGVRWMSDPNAPLASADDFGRQNSVLVVNSQFAMGAMP